MVFLLYLHLFDNTSFYIKNHSKWALKVSVTQESNSNSYYVFINP